MNTILTDDEIHKWWASENGMEDADMAKLTDFREVTRKVEAAVLAKLREQEPQDRERWLAVREGHFNAASAEYFNARQHLDTPENRRIFYAGHCKGYDAAPLPAVVQVPRGIDPDEADPVALWAEIARLQAAIQGPDGFNTWQEAAVHERQLRVKAERAAAPIEQDGESALTAEEQNRLDELLKHARWLMQSMPAMDGLQHSWALNARQAMVRMHDRLKMYLPPTTPRASEAPAQAVVQVPQGWPEPPSNFQEGQWWVRELDAFAQSPNATDDQKRAVAVVHHLLAAVAAPEAQAIPAPWREAVKVAREALQTAAKYTIWMDSPGLKKIDAAIAQLDALEGGE